MNPGQEVEYASGFLAATGIEQCRGVYIGVHPTMGKIYGRVEWEFEGKPSVVHMKNIRPVRKGKPRLSVARDMFVQEARDNGQVHGSALRDIFHDLNVSGALHDQDETILRELMEVGTLRPIAWQPTKSQAVFLGLQFTSAWIAKHVKPKAVAGNDPGAGLRSACLYRYSGDR